MKNMMKLCVGFSFGAVLFACPAAEKDREAEASPPAVSIQESKFDDLRPAEEKARFNNLKPLVEMVKHELFEAGFSVKDERDMIAFMGKNGELAKSKVGDGMEGDEPIMGNWKVPAFYLRMNVLQYGFQTVSQRNAMSGTISEKRYLQAQLTSTIVNARTGQLVGSANVKAGPLDLSTLKGENIGQAGNYDEQMLQALNQECAVQIVRDLTKKTPVKFRPMGATGRVLKVSDYGVLIKINQEKIKVGDILDVFKVEKLDDEEEEDEELVEEIYVGSVKVSELKAKYVVATPIATGAKFEKKQLVRPSTRYKSGVQVMAPAASTDSANPF